jgi:hypothetical protein
LARSATIRSKHDASYSYTKNRGHNPYPSHEGALSTSSKYESYSTHSFISNGGSKKEKVRAGFKWKALRGVSFASSVSTSTTYSEVVITFWSQRDSNINVQTQAKNYSGELERVTISLMYDDDTNLWSIESKLLKRPSYSSVDNEQVIAERVCFQEELGREIKRALLFFSISPKQAYKMFRQTCKQIFQSEYDVDTGCACVTQSLNSFEFGKELTGNKSSYGPSSYMDDDERYNHWSMSS